MHAVSARTPFRLNGAVRTRVPGPLGALLEPVIERALALDCLEEVYRRIPPAAGPAEFARRALQVLGARFAVEGREQFNIPASGPVVVVANHPLGGLDGLLLVWLVGAIRRDFRILGNSLLQRVPELAPCVLPVDVFGGPAAARVNSAALRGALGCLKRGGALAVFPAGEVSHLRPGEGVADPTWGHAAMRLARLASATVVPVYFEASQGPVFHLAGLVHPRLRSALLPRQLLARASHPIGVRVGPRLGPKALERCGDDRSRTRLARLVTYGLAVAESTRTGSTRKRQPLPIQQPVGASALRSELAALPSTQHLAGHGNLSVWYADAIQVPLLLQEIGRLREVTFRAVGEGTGSATDLDAFDQQYGHLFVWDDPAGCVVGAYRMGLTDRLPARHGIDGLYTRKLFRFHTPFLDALGPAVELGRSFIRAEYQRDFAPLMLLWKGIGHWLARHPRYRTLFGPVSVSARYSAGSRLAMVDCLPRLCGDRHLESRVRGRNPPSFNPRAGAYRRELLQVGNLDELDALVASLEPTAHGVPVLLRQYLKLGARVVGFNVDRLFADSIDCLVVADLALAERRVLDRYLGTDGAAAFRALHGSAMRRAA